MIHLHQAAHRLTTVVEQKGEVGEGRRRKVIDEIICPMMLASVRQMKIIKNCKVEGECSKEQREKNRKRLEVIEPADHYFRKIVSYRTYRLKK